LRTAGLTILPSFHFPHRIAERLHERFDYLPATGRLTLTGTWVDLPAIVIALLVTIVLVKGIRESASLNAGIVILKIAIVFFVIGVGSHYVNPANWHPFAPYGYTGFSFFGHTIMGQTGKGGEPLGMLAGAALLSSPSASSASARRVSTKRLHAMRRLNLTSLVLWSILYIAVAAVLRGCYTIKSISTLPSRRIQAGGLPWAQLLISVGAIAGITLGAQVMC
jgi:APA family basic amino acid/polyamine antiporter